MQDYYVDLHIHIGRTASGKPVKITGSKSLTIENILREATEEKGMDMIGVIDCQVPEVIGELESMIGQGKVEALNEGGLRFEKVTLILGAEIEVYDENCRGPIHVLCYMPTIEKMKEFSLWLSERQKNITLSTQRIYENARTLQQKVKELDGLFIPAHAFTPFKSLYGSGVKKSLTEILDPKLIDAIELGLSSNTFMADQIGELHPYTFVSNSDAHSVQKIAREYQVVRMVAPTFYELQKALNELEGREIVANYGLEPKLGKYHRTACENCAYPIKQETDECPNCRHNRFTKGVFDRLQELKNSGERVKRRPSYIHQVPLEFIPKLGPKTLEKLKNYFGTEMDILHHVTEEQLKQVIPAGLAANIIKAREGRLSFVEGGGGKYGSIASE